MRERERGAWIQSDSCDGWDCCCFVEDSWVDMRVLSEERWRWGFSVSKGSKAFAFLSVFMWGVHVSAFSFYCFLLKKNRESKKKRGRFCGLWNVLIHGSQKLTVMVISEWPKIFKIRGPTKYQPWFITRNSLNKKTQWILIEV